MSVTDVARKDFLDVRRAKVVWGPVLLYTLFMLLFFWGQSQSSDPNFYMIIWSLGGIGGALLIPLAALVASYLAIAGERESGSIKFALSLPVARGDLVLGKFLSRSAVVVGGILVAFLVGVAAAFVFIPDTTFEYGDYALFVLLTVLYALAYVSVAIALSAATASRSRAMGAAIGFFFVFNLIWNFLPVGPIQMVEFLFDQLGMEAGQNLTTLIYSLSPTGSYLNGLQLVVPEAIFTSAPGAATGGAWYTDGPFMLVLLALWVVVPLVLGYWRFTRADLT
ncbi:ABC transporter permease subunit [Halobacteriales archaeon Cl-PHB]